MIFWLILDEFTFIIDFDSDYPEAHIVRIDDAAKIFTFISVSCWDCCHLAYYDEVLALVTFVASFDVENVWVEISDYA